MHSPHGHLPPYPVFYIKLLAIALVLWASFSDTYAQSTPSVRLVPIPSVASPSSTSNARQQAEGNVLTLPFWDDFSQPTVNEQGFATPDTARWAENTGALVNTGLAIAPPSIGTVAFDGVDIQGQPYNQDTATTGNSISDQLTSCPIDLTTVADRGSVYLSFFWQAQGRGELPEEAADSIMLQFKEPDSDDDWTTVWRQSGEDPLVTDAFTQTSIPVGEAYFYDRFQFRFQSSNRQSGAFDNWNIDYVYLDQGRSATSLTYPDAAITSLPTSILGEYTHVPIKQFRADPSRYLTESSVDVFNLRDNQTPVAFEAFLRDGLTGQVLDRLSDSANVIPTRVPSFASRSINTTAASAETFDLGQDSIYLDVDFYISAGDGPLEPSATADYRTNDTVQTTFILNESFAYDDGTAEFGLELNQTGGRVAYQFVAPEEDLLTHIDINLPNFPQNQGTLYRLFVWKDIPLNDTTQEGVEEVVLRETDIIAGSPSLSRDGFDSIRLETPVTVQDTFYIGYQQESDGQFLIVGFDKNTNTSDRLFFSTSQVFEQNIGLRGSLMMRPRFDRAVAQLVTDLPDEQESVELTVFPNPSDGQLHIEGQYDQLQILDLLGREVLRVLRPQRTIDLQGQRPGLYVLRFNVGDKVVTRKVVLRPQ